MTLKMNYTPQWNVGRAMLAAGKLLEPRMVRAGAELRNRIIKKVSEGLTRRDGPSLPFNPPHKDSGRLASSFFYNVVHKGTHLSLKVATNLEYAAYLEKGTSKMKPRPYFRSTLREMKSRIKQILVGKR